MSAAVKNNAGPAAAAIPIHRTPSSAHVGDQCPGEEHTSPEVAASLIQRSPISGPGHRRLSVRAGPTPPLRLTG